MIFLGAQKNNHSKDKDFALVQQMTKIHFSFKIHGGFFRDTDFPNWLTHPDGTSMESDICEGIKNSDLAFIKVAYEKFKIWNIQENWRHSAIKRYCKKILDIELIQTMLRYF